MKPKKVLIKGKPANAEDTANTFGMSAKAFKKNLAMVNEMFQKKPGVMDRRVANLKIVKMLWQACKDQPDSRFGQILRNLGVVREIRAEGDLTVEQRAPRWVNEFNTESEFTLNNMIAEAKKNGRP